MKADGNYVAHLVDPDIPVNWDLVEQIVSNFFYGLQISFIFLSASCSKKVDAIGIALMSIAIALQLFKIHKTYLLIFQ